MEASVRGAAGEAEADSGGADDPNVLVRPSLEDIRSRLGAFVRGELLFDRNAELADDAPLLRGRIDSIGLMELLTFVEDEFSVILDPDDIDEEHFGSIERLSRLVELKLPSG